MIHASVDLSLVRRAQAGERGAFDLLVLKYQGRIRKLAERYLRDSDEAQDVVQDAFVKAYLSLKDFRGESAFYTWLYSIAANSARNHLARYLRGRRCNVDTSADGNAPQTPEELKDYTTPESIALEHELALQLTSSLAALSHDLRITLLLREIGGLSYEEIAQRTKGPIGTVRSRLFRAREALLRPDEVSS
jgi:RNA polymerase sigma-70 factor, ECF subfamily